MVKGFRHLATLGMVALVASCSSSTMTKPVANGTSTASTAVETTLPSVSLEEVSSSTSDGYEATLVIVVKLSKDSSSNVELLEPLRGAASAYIADHTSGQLLSNDGKAGLAALVEREAAMINGVEVTSALVTNFTITL